MLEKNALRQIEIRETCPSQNREKSVKTKLIDLAHISTIVLINMKGTRNCIMSSQFALQLL